MIFQRTLRRGRRSGATAAGMCGLAAGAVLLFCGAGSVPVENFTPQGVMQADLNAGGHNGTNFGTVQAATIASGTVSASGGVTGATSYIVYAGFHGTDNALQLAGSRDGKNFDRMQTSVFALPSGNCQRDDNILTQPNDPYRRVLKVGGWYYLAHTAGNFGQCGYFAMLRSHDLKNWTWCENVPVNGLTSVATTTLTTTAGSATVTLPGMAISGLTNGTFYTIGGAGGANVPAGAGFTYNSSSATQALLNSTGGASVNATASGTAAAITLTLINNVWSPDWYTPDGVNFYVLFRVSTQAGTNYGSPGIGYEPVTNVSAWENGSAPTFGSYVNLGLPSGSNGAFGPVLVGSTYYLFFDNGGNCHYATSSSPLSGYTDQGAVASHFQTDAGGNIESAQMIQISPTLWRFYFANTSTGLIYYSEASAISGATWSTAQQIVYMDGNGGLAAGCPVTLTNYDDIINALAAQASSPFYSQDNGYSVFSVPDSVFNFYTGTNNTGDGNANGTESFTVSEYGNVAYLQSGSFAFQTTGGGTNPSLVELTNTSASAGTKNWAISPYVGGDLSFFPANDDFSLPSNWAMQIFRNGLLRLGDTVQLDGSGLQSVPLLGTDSSGDVQAATLGSGVTAGLAAAANTSGGFVTQAGGDSRYAQLGVSNAFTAYQTITSSSNSGIAFLHLTNTGTAANELFIGDFGSAAGAGVQPGNALIATTNGDLFFVTDNGTMTGGSHTISFAAGGYNQTPQLVLNAANGVQMPTAGIGALAITSSSSATTGSGTALLGANCPATTATAPYTWIKMTAPDGSTVYMPAWK